MTTFYIKDFGCKVNQTEGEYLRYLLQKAGLREKDNPSDCQLVIINGCAVTSRAEQKAAQFIRKVKRENKDSQIILVGCLASLYHCGEGKYGIPDVYTIPQSEKIEGLLKRLEIPLDTDRLEMWYPLSVMPHHTRTFIKIQDGCNHFCSYCIVPYLRKSERSRSVESVIKVVDEACKKGVREIVLVGVRIGNWQQGKSRLTDLLTRLVKEFPDVRFRLSSIEPWEVTSELIDFIAEHPSIARYLHIPLQSGSAHILKLMRRPYTPMDYSAMIEEAVSKIQDLAVGTDIIVGFPGEKERDFQMTLELLEKLPLSYAHVFRYSIRPYTPSSKQPEQVPGKVKKYRAKIALKSAKKKREQFNASFLGKELEVLFEQKKGNFWRGYSSNYINCYLSSTENLRGKIVRVVGEKLRHNGLVCQSKQLRR